MSSNSNSNSNSNSDHSNDSEPRLRDHREIGAQLEIFASSPELGAGLPIWLPAGAAIRAEAEAYINELERLAGYQRVFSPPLGRVSLYERSGHWEHYQEDMFPPMDLDGGAPLVLRPMNCPHHILVFNARARSHRELPLRISELGQMFRKEDSGALEGLSRVRCMCLNDAHIFAAPDQVASEIGACVALIHQAYADMGIEPVRWRLSLRGSGSKYVADESLWEQAEADLRAALDAAGVVYEEAPGEAAFYGPKLDVQVADPAGHEESLSSIQLDFHLPERFDLSYAAAQGRARPVMIHRSIISSMERLVAHLLEAHQGRLPAWLAPVQVALVQARPSAEAAAWLGVVAGRLHEEGLRSQQVAPASLNAQVRAAELLCAPWILVVGDREAAAGSVSLRSRDGGEHKVMELEAALALMREQVASRA